MTTLQVWLNLCLVQVGEKALDKGRSLMGNDIGSDLSFKSVYFDYFSTNVGSSVIGTRTFDGFDDITH